jgi:hypothetical protein
MTTTPTIPPIGIIPQSTALSEAGTDSLSELMSRDPEGYSRQDRDRIVLALREQRARLEASEANKPKKAPGGSKLLLQTTVAAPEDMGL